MVDSINKNYPRIVISADRSGSGKTLLSTLIERYWQRSLKVQSFKCGPDYIDPSYHAMATGRSCANLDSRLMSGEQVKALFQKHAEGAQLNIIEGVMGLYDGAGSLDERGSAAHIAKTLKAPVIVILDVKSMARSAGALALGYKVFDPDVNVAGFLLNRVASTRHEALVIRAVEKATGLPVVGSIPVKKELTLPERHLGLIPAWEDYDYIPHYDALLELVEPYINWSLIKEIAEGAPPLGPVYESSPGPPKTYPVKIAYALDKAFHFYYQDNLDMFGHFGAQLVPFSPMEEDALPPGIDGLYLGGGYPEVFAHQLSQNTSMRRSIKDWALNNRPIWGECGGLMYLLDSLVTQEGEEYPMVGVFPGRTIMKKGLRALGYYTGELKADSWMGPKGQSLTGHLFHWSQRENTTEELNHMLDLTKEDSPEVVPDGLFRYQTWAGYLHLHFATNPQVLEGFLQSCWDHKE
ncbi:cobyrinate a,c-diamide synthase [Spirochaeta cellobiosiphila]|uniref:cobyrinate a,c-diamide synthase n=1 Tax=Spirochaeta cellobiosiphila TaxID=504483 RepID=UPI00055A2997|nr:cobyrinate a,c-diamide synthase [Spirochaeta cellobiosiphila]